MFKMYYWKRNFISQMRKVLLIINFSFIVFIARSQNQLVNIVNSHSGKIIMVKLGDRMTIQYLGYNGQLSFVKDEVTGADDSCIYLGRSYEVVSDKLSQRLQKNGRGYQSIIKYKDIVQFRRESMGRNLLKSSVLGLPIAFGSYLLVSDYLKYNQSASSFEQFLVVSAIGLTSVSLPKLLLPENLKHKVGNEWTFVPKNKFIP
jgi:hypothetical protein